MGLTVLLVVPDRLLRRDVKSRRESHSRDIQKVRDKACSINRRRRVRLLPFPATRCRPRSPSFPSVTTQHADDFQALADSACAVSRNVPPSHAIAGFRVRLDYPRARLAEPSPSSRDRPRRSFQRTSIRRLRRPTAGSSAFGRSSKALWLARVRSRNSCRRVADLLRRGPRTPGSRQRAAHGEPHRPRGRDKRPPPRVRGRRSTRRRLSPRRRARLRRVLLRATIARALALFLQALGLPVQLGHRKRQQVGEGKMTSTSRVHRRVRSTDSVRGDEQPRGHRAAHRACSSRDTNGRQ